MAHSADLSLEEAIGMGIAATLHVGLAAALLLQRGPPTPIPEPQRIVVSLAEEVALESTSPNPAPAAASVAPTLSDMPEPQPVELPPPPIPRATTPPPRPTPTATRRPTPTPTASRRPTPTPTSSRRPTPTASASRRATPTPTASRPAGGSRIGDDFLAGAGAGATANSGTPAATFGPTEQAALLSAITRQLRPHWSAPQGVDIELLVTVVRFRLNRDGSLNGAPTCTRQSGENASNRPQLGVHCERSIRAVTLAAPFRGLPAQYYDQWRVINSTFDRRL